MPLGLLWVSGAAGVGFPIEVSWSSALVLGYLAWRRLSRGVFLDFSFFALLALVVWAFFLTLVRRVPWEAAAPPLATGALVVLLACVVAHPAGRFWLERSVLAGGLLAAAWLIVERALLPGRPAGPFGNPNPAATWAVLALAVLWSQTQRRLVLPTFVLLGGVLASESRAAILAVGALAALRFFSTVHPRWRLTSSLVLFLCLVGFLWRLARDRDPLRFERIRIWRVAVQVVVDSFPLGTAPGGFREAAIARNFPRDGEFARFHRIPGLAESDVLQLAASLGVPGLLLGFFLVGRVVQARCRQGWHALAPALALGVTSGFHSQLCFPVVALPAVVAGRFSGSWRVRLAPSSALLLVWPVAIWAGAHVVHSGGPIGTAMAIVKQALAKPTTTPEELADCLPKLSVAAELAPRSSEVRRLLGFLQLALGQKTRDAHIVEDAVASFSQALERNPNDVWAALGEAEAWLTLGEAQRGQIAARRSLGIEPNCVPCWLVLCEAQYASGELAAARHSWRKAQEIKRKARRHVFVTNYESALVRADPIRVRRLAAALGEGS